MLPITNLPNSEPEYSVKIGCHSIPVGLYLHILLLLLLLLLFNMDVSCHRRFLSGTSLEPAVIPTAQASSFTLQYFLYYV